MQFSKLRLQGFKSFVDPTELTIANGLTGVVGPNGCGKSNLLEALRWVMGENRPTAMRGGGMEDVIFAGASTRPARNYAEVSLSIDNGERLAPASFNDSDVLEIVRRITRDAGSVYRTNGKETRARDVQMLFADASTGSHSPALVRQGQISELINAKPKSRRRVLEEAAGISGLYQRRHEAELKLNGAETNLARVEDVLEALASQLGQLNRQAKQAARYREIADHLRHSEGLLLYRRWREADLAREAAVQGLTAATQAAAVAQGKATSGQTARLEAEAKVPPLREEEAIAGAVLQRLLVQRDTLDDQEKRAEDAIATLERRIEQLSTDAEREKLLNSDAQETIEKLNWEQEALTKAAEGHDELLSAAQETARAAASALQDAEAQLDQLTEDAARLAARHQAAERRMEEATSAVSRNRSAVETAEQATEETRVTLAAAAAQMETAKAAQGEALKAAEAAEAALDGAEQKRAEAQSTEEESRGVRSEAEGALSTLKAEHSALARLVDRSSDGSDPILKRLSGTKGLEAALGAALADDLKAPEVGAGATGWTVLPDYDAAAELPGGAEPLSISAPAALRRRLSQTGLVDRARGADLQADLKPGQRLVSREGDLWRWDGFVVQADDAPSTAARDLEQRNRLTELSEALGKAEAAFESAAAAHSTHRAALQAAQTAESEARQARKAADENSAQTARVLSRADADHDMASGRLETLTLSLTRRREELDLATANLSEAEAGRADLGDLEDARAKAESQKTTVEDARSAMLGARAKADEVRREGDARTKRSQTISQEVSGWQHRLETAEKRLAELDERIATSQDELKMAQEMPGTLVEQREKLAGEIRTAEARRNAASDALAEGERVLREIEDAERAAERNASEAREARARAEAISEAAVETVGAMAERILEEMDTTPQDLLETLATNPDDMPSAEAIETDVNRLKRQRDALGAVNLRAEEDAREVSEELESLSTEKGDLEAAIGKLRSGIASLNTEGRQRLLQAFEEVNTHFAKLFTSLFGGGEANLVLVESDDPLEAGLEIMCQPPGKKLSTLSLLSGGEQTLTAMSLIFAVFLANPSPICVLDEVDAPLDDSNVTRFCDLLDEMARQTDTRFMIITHHAITMSRMDRLFGVTMAEQGVSQLVSVDLREAEKLIDG